MLDARARLRSRRPRRDREIAREKLKELKVRTAPEPSGASLPMASPSASWLLAPIRAPRALPPLPGAMEDALTRAGTCGMKAATATRGPASAPNAGESPDRKRKSSASAPGATTNPFTLAKRASSTPSNVTKPANAPLPAGDYAVEPSSHPGSVVRYEPRAFPCAPDDYAEIWAFSDRVARTRNPLNANTFIKRKQATFGAQVSARVEEPPEAWPRLVSACVDDALGRVRDAKRDAFAAGVAAHVNWYPDASAGMGRHADAEEDLIPDAPIFSYSFASGGDASPPRLFDLYRGRGAKKPFATVPLSHGDVLTMDGTTQRTHEHGVRASASKEGMRHSRVNITVRAFKPGSDALR